MNTPEVGKIYQGDCLEFMRQWPDKYFDLVLTDPPYGVRDDEWDDMSEREFARFCMGWLAEATRISGQMVVFCTAGSTIRKLCEMLYPKVRQIIWNKPPGSQYAGASEARLWFAHEVILHCHDGATWEVCSPKSLEVAGLIRAAREQRGISRSAVDIAVRGKKTGLCFRWEEAACLPTGDQVEKLKQIIPLNGQFDEALGRALEQKSATLEKAAEKAAEKTDVLSHRTVTGSGHPCEKPLGLMLDLIATIGKDARTILDPFAGSGSTLLAAELSGKSWVGIEKDGNYHAMATGRVDAERAQGKLF